MMRPRYAGSATVLSWFFARRGVARPTPGIPVADGFDVRAWFCRGRSLSRHHHAGDSHRRNEDEKRGRQRTCRYVVPTRGARGHEQGEHRHGAEAAEGVQRADTVELGSPVAP
jgi:hypothetical protein